MVAASPFHMSEAGPSAYTIIDKHDPSVRVRTSRESHLFGRGDSAPAAGRRVYDAT
jgi:hypothetical protein